MSTIGFPAHDPYSRQPNMQRRGSVGHPAPGGYPPPAGYPQAPGGYPQAPVGYPQTPSSYSQAPSGYNTPYPNQIPQQQIHTEPYGADMYDEEDYDESPNSSREHYSQPPYQGYSHSNHSSRQFSGNQSNPYLPHNPNGLQYPSSTYDDMPVAIRGQVYDEDVDPEYGAMVPHISQPRSRRQSMSRSISRAMSRSHSQYRRSDSPMDMYQRSTTPIDSYHRSMTPIDSYHRSSMDSYRRPNSTRIKFRRKGADSSGITLLEAQHSVKLSGNDSYRFEDLRADRRGRIHVKLRWPGYKSFTYEIPLDGYDGRVNLKTLARRVARACVHFFESNAVPVNWERLELRYLEENYEGTWQPDFSR